MSENTQTPTSQTQTTQVQTPQYHIDVDIKVEHIFNADTYYKTKVLMYVFGEVVVDGRRIKIPYLYTERGMFLTGSIDYELQKTVEDIVDLKQRMLEMINNLVQNRQRLLSELSKYGNLTERFAQD
jgi:hypothetical protein